MDESPTAAEHATGHGDPRASASVQRVFYHVVIPAVVSVAFFMIAMTPVEVFGCRNRGLMALAAALVGLFGALATALLALRATRRRDPSVRWWLVSTLILLVPPIALIMLA